MSTTLFTAYKYITPDTETVEVHGEITIGDDCVDIASDVTVEFDEQEHEVEFTEKDIEELTTPEVISLLSALWRHHIGPAIEDLGEAGVLDGKEEFGKKLGSVCSMKDLVSRAREIRLDPTWG